MAYRQFVRLLDILEDENSGSKKIHCIFEFCDKVLVNEIANRRKAASVEYTKKVVRELLEAVDILHAKMIMHRDIKPENVLLCGGGAAQLCGGGAHQTQLCGGARIKGKGSRRGYGFGDASRYSGDRAVAKLADYVDASIGMPFDAVVSAMVGDTQRLRFYSEVEDFQAEIDVPDAVWAALGRLVGLGYTSHLCAR